MRKISPEVPLLLGFILLFAGLLPAQNNPNFSRADTLRGSLSPLRSCYDVHFYELELKIDYPSRSISGSNDIHFKATKPFYELQVDLFENMKIDQIEFEGASLDFQREFNAVFVSFPRQIAADERGNFKVRYHGQPIEAENAPWDGGFVWKTDKNERPWVGVACEGIGASLWWPLKDHPSDEPDSMNIIVHLPPGDLNPLMAVCNGQLTQQLAQEDGTQTWAWKVSYPINSYNVTLNIADYVHLHDEYQNASGQQALDYYLLRGYPEGAVKHLAQVKPMLECFEKYFGEYPYWQDGYALVETSYWGMEHQGAIAYGNGFKNNPFGFDFIIVHESGHEWWGNNVSARDHAELWIHESFCTYAEAIYVEHFQGYEKMIEYLHTQREKIRNKSPMVGPLGVNYNEWQDADIYYKGTWFLHTLRSVIDHDERWFSLLKEMQARFSPQPVSTWEIISFFNEGTGLDLEPIFREYLYSKDPPLLEYSMEKKGNKCKLNYRWVVESGERFSMPVRLRNSEKTKVYPTTKWQSTVLKLKSKENLWDTDQAYFLTKNIER